MPPDSGVDFDMHLERNIRDLRDLQSDMVVDIFMVYCVENIPDFNKDDAVHPRTIKDDLEKAGLKV